MSAPKGTFRDQVTRLRRDPRVAAFSLLGPGGQIFDLVDVLVDELERQAEALRRQAAAIAELERQAAGGAPARINPLDHVHPLPGGR